MPDLRNFLSRFRPAGTPGAPMRGGVPADRVAEREAELQPVLELLEETRTQAERIRAAAREAADGRRLRAGSRPTPSSRPPGCAQAPSERPPGTVRWRRCPTSVGMPKRRPSD